MTDGVHLYEFVRAVNTRNYGLCGGWMKYLLVEDSGSGEHRLMSELEVAICEPVFTGRRQP